MQVDSSFIDGDTINRITNEIQKYILQTVTTIMMKLHLKTAKKEAGITFNHCWLTFNVKYS